MKDIGSLFKQVSDDPWLWLRVYDKSNIYLIVGSLGRFRHLKLLREIKLWHISVVCRAKKVGNFSRHEISFGDTFLVIIYSGKGSSDLCASDPSLS